MSEYCPTRKYGRGQKPNITGCGVKVNHNERYEPWVNRKKEPDENIKKIILKEAMMVVLKFIMKHHVYEFNNELMVQKEGGAIGVELTGELVRVFMIWWERSFKRKVIENNMKLHLYKRYVDDVNIVAEAEAESAAAAAEKGEKGIINDIDDGKQKDERTMERLKEIGNSIHRSIQLEADYPSRYDDKKLPILDVKVWLETNNGVTKIKHEYYHKDISSKLVIAAASAIDWKTKRTVITQQLLRVLRNCSPDLPWNDVCQHMNKMMIRIQLSGYDKKFRYEVLQSALKAYEIMKIKDETGEVPMYRAKNWKRHQRKKERELKKENWYKIGGYKSIIFAPATPQSQLAKIWKERIEKSGLKIKVIERAGKSLKSVLHTSRPFKREMCNREDCKICRNGGKGNCDVLGVTYKTECMAGDGEYNGQTSRTAYLRAGEHVDDLEKRKEYSHLWKHCQEKHNGEVQEFKFSVSGTYTHDSLLRQVTEAVKIRNVNEEITMNTREELTSAKLY